MTSINYNISNINIVLHPLTSFLHKIISSRFIPNMSKPIALICIAHSDRKIDDSHVLISLDATLFTNILLDFALEDISNT